MRRLCLISPRWCIMNLQLSCFLHVRLITKSVGKRICAFITHGKIVVSVFKLPARKQLNVRSYLQTLSPFVPFCHIFSETVTCFCVVGLIVVCMIIPLLFLSFSAQPWTCGSLWSFEGSESERSQKDKWKPTKSPQSLSALMPEEHMNVTSVSGNWFN